MKSVLISIQPKWCELIARGEKTVEVRKTRPKIETPFKVYIYETKGRTETPFVDEEGHYIFKGRGQVIGEFVCKGIEKLFQCNSGWVEAYACIPRGEFFDYLGIPRYTHLGYDKMAYGWLISDLVIYDEPRELSEFKTLEWFRDCEKGCPNIERMRCPTKDSRKVDKMCGWCRKGGEPITRPPQSWCYVESEECILPRWRNLPVFKTTRK